MAFPMLVTPPTFLSTLPARGATGGAVLLRPRLLISIHAPREGSDRECRLQRGLEQHFYPRSPRGERPYHVGNVAGYALISIHAPREGSDRFPARSLCLLLPFLSTLPARGATGDSQFNTAFSAQFLSTLPARGATYTYTSYSNTELFLSTLPARGATAAARKAAEEAGEISIHAPREGSDSPCHED